MVFTKFLPRSYLLLLNIANRLLEKSQWTQKKREKNTELFIIKKFLLKIKFHFRN